MTYGLKRIGVASTALRSGNVELPLLGSSPLPNPPRRGEATGNHGGVGRASLRSTGLRTVATIKPAQI